ncbi:hypothetical protein MRX96_046875, partial [Rhipicephalus microplus]
DREWCRNSSRAHTLPAYDVSLPRDTLPTASSQVIAAVDFIRNSGAIARELTPLAWSAWCRRLRRR